MDVSKIVLPVVKAGTDAVLHFLKQKPEKAAAAVKEAAPKVAEQFGGVSLAEWSALAKEVCHGLNCTLHDGYLWFHFKSKRGHQTLHTQMYIDEAGRLAGWVHHYAGEIRSAADDFIELANKKILKK